MTTIYKIDIHLYIGLEPTQDGKYRSGSLQPEYMTHMYSFKKDPGEQEPEYICLIYWFIAVLTLLCRYIEDYGLLVWTKASWEAYPPEIKEEADKKYEELQKEFVGK